MKMWGKWNVHTLLLWLQIVSISLEISIVILQGVYPQFHQVNPLFNIYPKDIISACYSDTATLMFTASKFSIANLLIQSRSSSTDEWIKKLWCIYTMDYYSIIKKNDSMAFVSKWVDLENIILSEINKLPKPKIEYFCWYIKTKPHKVGEGKKGSLDYIMVKKEGRGIWEDRKINLKIFSYIYI